jgi:hypothetical protein
MLLYVLTEAIAVLTIARPYKSNTSRVSASTGLVWKILVGYDLMVK